MDDIVERLGTATDEKTRAYLSDAAADEIDRLKAEVDRLRAEVDRLTPAAAPAYCLRCERVVPTGGTFFGLCPECARDRASGRGEGGDPE